MTLSLRRGPRPTDADLPNGTHMLHRPSGAAFVRTEPYPHGFKPKHCAGDLETPSGCLHHHEDDVTCGCGQAILGPEDEVMVLQVRPPVEPKPGQPPAPFVRHSRESCHQVSNASVAAGAVSA